MDDKPVWDPQKVRKAVVMETLQHPATLLTGSTAIISALYISLISGSKEGLLIALGSLGLSAGSWIYNYFFRTDVFVQKYFDKWQKEMGETRQKSLEAARETLVAMKYEPGIRAFDDLVAVYKRFEAFVDESNLNSLTSMQKVRLEGVASETYDLGMKTIIKLVSLLKVVRSIDIDRYKSEIEDLNREMDLIRKKSKNSETKKLEYLEKRKMAIQARINSYNDATIEIEGLLTKAEECENAIENSILQMPVISGKIDDNELKKAVSSMENTVEAARRVSQRMQQFSENYSEDGQFDDDDMYLDQQSTKNAD